MNTFKKGDEFEQRVFEAIKQELNAERLGLLPNSCQLFRKKGYYSKDRETDIIVDISIEVKPPDTKNWAILWVCECKNYNHPVPVDDVEEFNDKLRQIAGANVKGVMASSNSFHRGALNYARNKGIGLFRLLPYEQVEWYMHFMGSIDMRPVHLNPIEFDEALTIQEFRGKGRRFYGSLDGYIFGNMYSLLKHLLSR